MPPPDPKRYRFEFRAAPQEAEAIETLADQWSVTRHEAAKRLVTLGLFGLGPSAHESVAALFRRHGGSFHASAAMLVQSELRASG